MNVITRLRKFTERYMTSWRECISYEEVNFLNAEKKVDKEFIISSFSTKQTLDQYSTAVTDIGLWESEKVFFKKYLPPAGKILDIGCGAGRTTFGLYKIGYKNIIGLDLCPDMINEAKGYCEKSNLDISFLVGDACSLSFDDRSFDGCLFSFNGIMQIPQFNTRVQAMSEICRVLKPGGVFIFTTHDRDMLPEWKWFWDEEVSRWENGLQDIRLHEFGDRIIEDGDRTIYLHFPTREEVIESISKSGLELIEDQWLPDIANERDIVMKTISECRFWAARRV